VSLPEDCVAAPEKIAAAAPSQSTDKSVCATFALAATAFGQVQQGAAQRIALRSRTRTSNPILQASINVIGALDNVSQAVGQPADDVRQMIDEANRWTAVEDEFRTMLSGIAGANLIRRQRIALIASQAFSIGAQLARDPAHAVLVPHVQEIRRLKSFKRRKKAPQAPGTPPPPPVTAPPAVEA
jgi:hypothetical protein